MEELEISRRNMKKSGRWALALAGLWALGAYGTYKYNNMDREPPHDPDGISQRYYQTKRDLVKYNEIKMLNSEIDKGLVNIDNLETAIITKEEELHQIENNPTYQAYTLEAKKYQEDTNVVLSLSAVEAIIALGIVSFIQKHYMRKANIEIEEYRRSKEIGATA